MTLVRKALRTGLGSKHALRGKLSEVHRASKKRSLFAEAIIARRKAKLKLGLPKIQIRLTPENVANSVRTLSFGAVTVSHSVPDYGTLVVNVNAGREALGRAKSAFIKPGVNLQHPAGVPRFRADADNPKVLIREVDGRVDRGHLVDGAFVTVD